jgi:hypothetical protein
MMMETKLISMLNDYKLFWVLKVHVLLENAHSAQCSLKILLDMRFWNVSEKVDVIYLPENDVKRVSSWKIK